MSLSLPTYRRLLRAKLHRATITQANRDYEGSITLPQALIEAASLIEYESVAVWDVTNGNRLETYVIRSTDDSNDICMNGAAAHLIRPGDIVIIAAFSWIPEEDLSSFQPKIVFVGPNNEVARIGSEVPFKTNDPSLR